jgi:hypothetical protein
MRTTEVVKPLQECAKERETIELGKVRGVVSTMIAPLICCAGESVR